MARSLYAEVKAYLGVHVPVKLRKDAVDETVKAVDLYIQSKLGMNCRKCPLLRKHAIKAVISHVDDQYGRDWRRRVQLFLRVLPAPKPKPKAKKR